MWFGSVKAGREVAGGSSVTPGAGLGPHLGTRFWLNNLNLISVVT